MDNLPGRIGARPFIFTSRGFLSLFLLFALTLGWRAGMGQTARRSEKEWAHIPSPPAAKAGAERWVQPQRGELFELDHAAFRKNYASVARAEPTTSLDLGTIIELPMPDGTLAKFKIVEAPVMEPGLAAKFPEIKTYAGQGIDDPHATVRLDLSPLGFHAQVLSPHGAVYVDPAYRGDVTLHVSYYKRDHQKFMDDFQCEAEMTRDPKSTGLHSSEANKVQSGQTLRTFRLAVACTGEYSAFFGGTPANAMSAIVSAVNRVNGVYETELAVRLVLIANNDLVIYTDSATDPYSNSSGSTMLAQNQSNLDAIIGTGGYDMGHVFSTGGGGIATLASVCNSTIKGRGVTGSSSPTGDSFWIDFVAHEMGHQFGGRHTFNATTGSCSGNRSASTAFEPGSGLTIMAYAGICSPNNLQTRSDAFFHAGSLDEIQAFLTSGGGQTCAATSATGNQPPTISAGASYTIPASTPFVLTATSSDPNGDPLTYCWEEMDLGASAALTDPDDGTIPLFRSMPPTNTPVRYFPKLSSVLANTNWNQEKLPTTSRILKFRVTARDNRVGGGGVSDSDTTVTSVSGTGPFAVTSPNTGVTWSGTRTVTWNVAGSSSAPINATGVNIYLSTNGGSSFPHLLGSNLPNNGSANIILPNVNSSVARIKVGGAANIFYDVSDVNFTIVPGSSAPLVQLLSTALVAESCVTTNRAIDPNETVSVRWVLKNVGTSPSTNLLATLLATNGVYYPSAPKSYGVIPAGGTATQAFSFIASGACGGSITALLKLTDGNADMGTLAQTFKLGPNQSQVSTQTFQNTSLITIRDNNTSTPYPSTITVSGVTGSVVKVTAKLMGLSHTYPDDVDILLVGANSQNVMLMGGCGGEYPISFITVTFDDYGPYYMPQSQLTSQTYRPSNYYNDTMTSPAPAGPYGTLLSPLATNPNGQWKLYIVDLSAEDSGSISGGWSLSFVTSNSLASCCNSYPNPSFTSTSYSNNAIHFSWTSMPSLQYQIQTRTNLTLGNWVNFGAPLPGTGNLLTTNNLAIGGPMRFFRVVVGP